MLGHGTQQPEQSCIVEQGMSVVQEGGRVQAECVGFRDAAAGPMTHCLQVVLNVNLHTGSCSHASRTTSKHSVPESISHHCAG
jgi:hypothetical protein